jgi:hypothetical protein
MSTVRQAPVTTPLEFASDTRRIKPVKWWAAIGAACIALQTYVFIAWLTSGEVKPTSPGPTEMPTWMLVSIRTQEVVGVLATIAVGWFFLVRPWRRQGHISLDGMLFVCFLLIWWQDPLINYSAPVATYNANLLNFGSWTTKIPGWLTPNGQLFPEPVIWASTAYLTAVFGAAVFSNVVMRKAKQRWPGIGTLGLIGVCVGFFIVFDLVAELIWVRTGIYFYPGTIRSLSIFPGRYYQFPIYEPLLFGVTWAFWGCLRYFRDDKGRTVAERGIDDMRATPGQKTWWRFLALVGMTNVLFLWCNVGWQFFALHADPWPKDVTSRSYMTDQFCGPGTTYACPGPAVPINRPDSAHIDPAGRLVKE